jgi:pimeloyl-ACP methyl ester carboxylesterase
VFSLRTYSFLAVLCVALITGCTKVPPPLQQTPLKPKSLTELRTYLLGHDPDLDLFRSRGPFEVAIHEDQVLRLSPRERIEMDLFLSSAGEKAPLVVFVHGHDSSKGAHFYQAAHVASWGMHAIALQLPRNGPWSTNGRTLGRIVSLIQRAPELVDTAVDASRIVLVGHSFGATSVVIALGDKVPVTGAILLDPAAIGKTLPDALRRVSKPVLVLGADDHIQSTRNRPHFYRFIRSGISEVSIRGAAHEDAQYPSEYALQNFGQDPYTTEEAQKIFATAIAAAAFSVSATGGFDYAWKSFEAVLKNGEFFNPKKK